MNGFLKFWTEWLAKFFKIRFITFKEFYYEKNSDNSGFERGNQAKGKNFFYVPTTETLNFKNAKTKVI